MGSKPLLVEIGTEELPGQALPRLGESLAEHLQAALVDARLVEPGETSSRWFATPRRLAVRVPRVRTHQSEQLVERRGPAVTASFSENGDPTRAAMGFARSCGVEVADLERLRNEKGEWLVFRHAQPGRAARELIEECLEQALRRLPIPKRMRWGDCDAEFVRPVHWLVVLHGATLVKIKLLAVKSGQTSRGHRFHAPGPVTIENADAYEANLAEARVIADFDARRTQIRVQIKRLGSRHGGNTLIDDDLLNEVTALVEWPKALLGSFDSEFLELPREVLISSMQDHQKYFPVTDGNGRLQSHFIAVSNIESTSPQRVRRGNERVLRARLADARFFWNTDRKIPLIERREALANVLFHHRLGTVLDKSRRVESLAGFIARGLRLNVQACQRAAALAKADLVSDMVGEFPALQGVMGHYYALGDGESPAVAEAIASHYQPRFAGDALPATEVGRVVAIADKLDTVVGLHAGEIPTGEKDPYALRRAALGVLRILIEREMDLDLSELIKAAGRDYQQAGIGVDAETETRVFDFMLDRLRACYTASGFAADELAAVLECRPPRPHFDLRLKAVAQFRTMEQAQSLTAANKRIRNILRRAEGPIPDQVAESLLIDIGEQELAAALVTVASDVWPLVSGRRYTEALEVMAGFQGPIDRFFDEVLVMTNDAELRGNRLALLGHVSRLFLSIADVSKLQDPGAPA